MCSATGTPGYYAPEQRERVDEENNQPVNVRICKAHPLPTYY
jgi:hypothetical protein